MPYSNPFGKETSQVIYSELQLQLLFVMESLQSELPALSSTIIRALVANLDKDEKLPNNSSLHSSLVRLTEKGLATRVKSKKNPRQYEYSLTKLGSAKAKSMQPNSY